MKHLSKIGHLLAFCLLFISCSEEEQGKETFTGSYQFFLYAEMGGKNINFNAGENGYVLHTSYEERDSLLQLRSLLAQDSANPHSAFEVILRGEPGPSAASKLLQRQALALADPSGMVRMPHTYDYRFYTDSLVGHQVLTWTCLGKNYYGDTLFWPKLNTREVKEMEVKLSNNGFASCVPLMTKKIDLKKDCRAKMDLQSNSSGSMQLSVSALKGDIQNVRWLLNNKPAGQGFTTTLQGSNSSMPQRIKAEVYFAAGCQMIIEKTVIGGRADCDINMFYDRTETVMANPNNEMTAELIYYDESGKRYTSFYLGNKGHFNIEAVNAYQEASASFEKHNKLVFTGDLTLQSQDGSTININRLHGSFAVAHP